LKEFWKAKITTSNNSKVKEILKWSKLWLHWLHWYFPVPRTSCSAHYTLFLLQILNKLINVALKIKCSTVHKKRLQITQHNLSNAKIANYVCRIPVSAQQDVHTTTQGDGWSSWLQCDVVKRFERRNDHPSFLHEIGISLQLFQQFSMHTSWVGSWRCRRLPVWRRREFHFVAVFKQHWVSVQERWSVHSEVQGHGQVFWLPGWIGRGRGSRLHLEQRVPMSGQRAMHPTLVERRLPLQLHGRERRTTDVDERNLRRRRIQMPQREAMHSHVSTLWRNGPLRRLQRRSRKLHRSVDVPMFYWSNKVHPLVLFLRSVQRLSWQCWWPNVSSWFQMQAGQV